MGYEVALDKSWQDILKLDPPANLKVKFLADEYCVDFVGKRVFSLSCNVAAKDSVAILLLHYLAARLSGLPAIAGEWVNFKELSGLEGYAQAFRNRAIEPILRKYGSHPENILSVLDRLPGKRVPQADIAIVLEVFEAVPILIEMWRPDEEFGPEANMLFDRSIKRIFCIEDTVVLAQFVASQL